MAYTEICPVCKDLIDPSRGCSDAMLNGTVRSMKTREEGDKNAWISSQ